MALPLDPAAVEYLCCYRTVHEPVHGPVPSTNWIVDFCKCSRHHEQLADLCVCSRPGWFWGFRLLDVDSDRSWRIQAERASQGEWNHLNGTFSACFSTEYVWNIRLLLILVCCLCRKMFICGEKWSCCGACVTGKIWVFPHTKRFMAT